MPSVEVALSLGSNLGNRAVNIATAVRHLEQDVIDDVRISSFFESAPVDCPQGVFDFLNVALTATTNVSAMTLLRQCQRIEAAMGRPAGHNYHDNRIIDIDILLFGDEIIDTADLIVPHPRMFGREFVMVPLAELAQEWLKRIRDRLSVSKAETARYPAGAENHVA